MADLKPDKLEEKPPPKDAPRTPDDRSQEAANGSLRHQPVGKENATLLDEEVNGEKTNENESAGLGHYLRIFSFCDRLSRWLYILSIAASIASGAAFPLMTIIFGQFSARFSNFASDGNNTGGQSISPEAFREDTNSFTLWFIYIFIGRFVMTYIANLSASVAAMRTTSAMRKKVLETTLRQEVWYFDKVGLGSISSQMTTSGNQVYQGIADKMVQIVQGLSMFFSAFIVALAVQWKLALITMSIVPAIVLVTVAGVSIESQQESRVQQIYSNAAVMAQEVLGSIRTIHALWAQEKVVTRYGDFLSTAHNEGRKKSITYGVCYSIDFFCVLAGTALAFWQGNRMFQSGEIGDVGPVLTVILSVTLGATALSFLTPHLQAIANATSASAALFAVIDKTSLLDPLAQHGDTPLNCTGTIEFSGTKFAYPSRPEVAVLPELNLHIPAGKTTALVGASGCGKSTMIALLERWYVPQSGTIFLDGKDISTYNTRWLRSQMRLVQQEPVLFRGSVFENVARGFTDEQRAQSPQQQMEIVRKACKDSYADEFIERLPHGYQTQVGERASMLSGGQKQRIAIARSIVSEPRILLLDEATSALDSRSEAIVQQALKNVCRGRTTLVVAHKLATIQHADQIVVLSRGKVAESGTHAELIAHDGQYAAMIRAQRLHGEDVESSGAKEGDEPAAVLDVKEESLAPAHENSPEQNTSDTEDKTPGTINASFLGCLYIIIIECDDLKAWFLGIALACLIAGGTYPAQAILFSRLIQTFHNSGGEAQNRADFFALMLFVVALANLAAYFFLGWACNTISQSIGHRYRKDMFDRMVHLDAAFFDQPLNASGALTSRLSTAPAALQEMVSGSAFLILVVIVNIVSTGVLAIAFGWKLGLVLTFSGLPLLVGCGFIRSRLEIRLDQVAGDMLADGAALANEAVNSIRTVASLTLESQICNEYAAKLDAVNGLSHRTASWIMLPFALSQSLEFLVMALGFWYGSRLISTGEYSPGQFFVIFIAIVLGGQAAAQFFGHTASMAKAQNATNYILWLRTQTASICENSSNSDIGPTGNGALRVERVEFSYAQRPQTLVLKGIDMDIPPGSFVACVGPSGCGKSTVIALLERYYDPISGSISLDGRSISTYSPRLYRRFVSLVQQETILFEGTVRDNITIGVQGEPTDDQVLEACRQANALEFTDSLPQGLKTPCGSNGLQFSGGQRQRIAIARALIRKPHVLLLDEATSALDTQSERIVQDALSEASSGRTTFAVAHRLSTIKNAYRIFVLESGRVVEQGSHEQLLALKGRYYEMYLSQQLEPS